MPPKILEQKPLTDEQVDKYLGNRWPLDEKVVVVLRNMQAQITALESRIAALEP